MRSRDAGQTAVEYLLATLMILMFFMGLYATLQKGIAQLFRSAAKVIVAVYVP